MKKMLVLLTDDWDKFCTESELKILKKFGSHARKFSLTYFCELKSFISLVYLCDIKFIVFQFLCMEP